ncbi:asl3360 [Nostoc sp. PCC 7120 = FACHB-418]|nr:asl3360 [Nostoc sp. PCC 7120 = FACHB-418]
MLVLLNLVSVVSSEARMLAYLLVSPCIHQNIKCHKNFVPLYHHLLYLEVAIAIYV